MCGFWNPTAKKKGLLFLAWLDRKVLASLNISISGNVLFGIDETLTGHN